MVSCHGIEEVEASIRAGWHVADDCCDNCSGQRKRQPFGKFPLGNLNQPLAFLPQAPRRLD